jgi:antitoxin (DNA-binding transcriptional repressor) of toxin-antitoxin stability system
MSSITLEEAQTGLAKLIHGLAPGDEILITENSRPIAKLVASNLGRPRPVPGRCKGMLTIVTEDDEHLDEFDA